MGIYCSINGNKYKCLFGKSYVTFYDVKNKSNFLTVENDKMLKDIIKNPFFNISR